MQSTDLRQLGTEAESVSRAAFGLIDWVKSPANSSSVGAARVELERSLRRDALLARRLASAAGRKMCIGVFGPSQAGKSYLVSQLARRPGESLALRIGERSYDFLSEINPPGNRESTGLVTRFGVNLVSASSELPVQIRLLSQTDIIKILGNSFFLDFDVNAPLAQPMSAEAVQERIDSLREQMTAPEATDPLDADDVFDVAEYFMANFPGQTAHLGAEFWDQAMMLAPRLRGEARASLWATIWADFKPFTDLYLQLYDGLRRMRFASSAAVAIEALIPRESSIIDVQTLDRLGTDQDDLLRVRPAVVAATGETVSVPRSLLCALTAELVAPLVDIPRPFFERADLLDFPGARSRFKLKALEDVGASKGVAEGANPLRELLLRGKIAYLFQRYTMERELSALLLCVADGNQEVRDLSDMVRNWVDQTQGATPAERKRQAKALMLVLTKMDREFETKAGDTPQSRRLRWKSRIDNSLVGNFRGGWPLDWDGQPFDKVFWLRNPEVLDEGRIEYRSTAGRQEELALRPAFENLVREMQNHFLENPEVTRHFADPLRAWMEAMTLNDGGVTYLIESLAPLGNGELKRRQIEEALHGIRTKLLAGMSRFHVSGDVEQRLQQRRLVADSVIDNIYADTSRLGPVLRALQLDFVALRSHLHRVALRGTTQETAPSSIGASRGAPGGSPPPSRSGLARPGLARPGSAVSGPTATQVSPSQARVSSSRPTWSHLAAEAALALWNRQMSEASGEGGVTAQLGVPRETVTEIASELMAAARRDDLVARIEADITRVIYLDADLGVAKAAIVGTQVVNRFVSELGFDRVEPSARPMIEGNGVARPVFQPRSVIHDIDDWPSERPAFEAEFAQSWAFAFYAMVEANARSEAGLMVDLAQNQRLGDLLAALAPNRSAGLH